MFEDHFGVLTKLQQTKLVKEYQLQFEQLLNCVGKLLVPHQLWCFVSGLKVNLRNEVQVARPAMEVIGLARLYEACHQGTQNIFGMNTKEPEPPPLSVHKNQW
jgi:hypothetical protein